MDVKKPNGSGNGSEGSHEWRVKVGLAEMLKGGVIMDVTNAEQAKIAEDAGDCAVMALERVPSDIRKEGGVARMASIKVIREIMNTVTIPVMAKVRIGHFAEAEVLQALEVDFVDDGPGKPVGIQKFIGRRPIAAFGNSDGDLQMLQWTCSAPGQRLCLYVHHTDAEREWAYDRTTSIGKLDKGLDEAISKGWTVVNMKTDWKQIFAFETKPPR